MINLASTAWRNFDELHSGHREFRATGLAVASVAEFTAARRECGVVDARKGSKFARVFARLGGFAHLATPSLLLVARRVKQTANGTRGKRLTVFGCASSVTVKRRLPPNRKHP